MQPLLAGAGLLSWLAHRLSRHRMHLPDVIRARIASFIDGGVDLCDASKNLPFSEQYKLTVEHSWVLEYYEQHRPSAQFERSSDLLIAYGAGKSK